MICTYETDGGWVISDGGTWLPGVYESEAVARQAARLEVEVLESLNSICHVDGENRLITADDLLGFLVNLHALERAFGGER